VDRARNLNVFGARRRARPGRGAMVQAMPIRTTRTGRPRSAGLVSRALRSKRRGVTAILAMMFMVLFGSLAAAMAIASQGNLQTAQTHLVVTRALGALDTGVRLAEARLKTASNQFRIERGEIDAAFLADLWAGTFDSSDGQVLFPDGNAASIGMMDVLLDLHALDNTVEIEPEYTPLDSWAVPNPVVLEVNPDGGAVSATQITYIPLPDQGAVRAVVTGYAWDYMQSRWVTRTAQQDFEVLKRVEHAVLGPSKIMIGKNVQINGSLGAVFEAVDNVEGHPVMIRSDFYGLDPVLDAKLDDFYVAVATDDTDGDNRLKLFHAVENNSISLLNQTDYDGDASADNAFGDGSQDGHVDEFDIFLKHYDSNGDGRLVLSNELTAGTPSELLSPEFVDVDDDMGLLIDSGMPDRNGDDVVDDKDTVLGYRDGVLDYKDRYAKVRGSVSIRVTREAWEAQPQIDGTTLGDYQPLVRGAVRAEPDEDPIAFDVPERLLPNVNTDTFDAARNELASLADGAPFYGGQYPMAPPGLITNADGTVIGQNWPPGSTIIESTPFDSPAPADWYERPVIENWTFKDVTIPRGLNALFINCTFVGVTRVESYEDNTHPAWQFYGQQNKDGTLKYPPPPAFSDAQLDNDYYTTGMVRPSDFDVPRLVVDGVPYATTKPLSNNIRFESCTFIGSVVADKPTVYSHIRNKLQFTGATKFHREHPDYPDDPSFNPQAADQDEIDKSAMLLPHYSVDIGKNNASPDQDVNLLGLIIAGVLDVRGNTTIDGALLLTFQPAIDDPALLHFGRPAGNPANYNITLGYFGAADGDEEGLAPFEHNGQTIVGFDTDADGYVDTTEPGLGTPVLFNGYGRVIINWNPNLVMPDGLVSPVSTEPVVSTYREGRLNASEY